MNVLSSTRLISISCLLALAAPAIAQQADRMAVSPSLSPQDAGLAFERTVIDVCVTGISSGRGVAQLPDAREDLSVSTDPQTRQQAGASEDETVWDVQAGRGVVTVREKPGRCAVSVYGPPAAPTIILMAARLGTEGFERMAVAGRGGLSQSLQRTQDGRQVQVILTGSDPGSPGHNSRFSVVTATVFDMAGG